MTNAKKIEERTFILQCLELYKSLPALWNLRSKEYTNKHKKNESYGILLEKYREMYPEAVREDVTKKLNSLRTNYRKELKRINALKRDGSEDVESTLWYFEKMNFLTKQNVMKNSAGEKLKEEHHLPIIETTDLESEDVNSTDVEISPTIKKRKTDRQDDLIISASEQYFNLNESEYDKIAKTWAVELQKLSPEQQIYAKKAIYDILYEGQLGNLYQNCVQIHSPPS